MPSGAMLMTTTEPWVSVEDVAKHLGVARDSVYRWIESRGLPAHKVGRIWKFKLSQVDAWVEAGGAKADDDGEVRK
jgi:excisionase family DNA binding protein